MPQTGNSTPVEFSAIVEHPLIMVSFLLVLQPQTGRSEIHGVLLSEKLVTLDLLKVTLVVFVMLPHTQQLENIIINNKKKTIGLLKKI